MTPRFIQPERYPFYVEVTTNDGTPLAEALQGPDDIVLSQNVADVLDASVGDRVTLKDARGAFTVRGIVPTDAEISNPFDALLVGLYGFYYLTHDALEAFGDITPQTDTLFIRLDDDPNEARIAEINDALLAEFGFFESSTPADIAEQNEAITENVGQLMTVMGLVSLLLGSIGILNTMQVIVRRRTVEIAVLKTLGLQGDQVTVLFLTEAFIIGLLGSLAGIALGWGLTALLTLGLQTGTNLFEAQALVFQLDFVAALNGLIVGTLVATVFGFLPTLTAARVRPGIVLRPTNATLPRAGLLRVLLTLILTVFALTFITRGILGGDLATSFGVTAGAFIAAGVIYALLNLLIWLLARLIPSLGLVDLKIALRQMRAVRRRAALTLLALVIGVFSLSLITLFAETINSLLRVTLAEGGNVIIAAQSENAADVAFEALDTLDGVENYEVSRTYALELQQFEDVSAGETLELEAIRERLSQGTEADRQMMQTFGPPSDESDGEREGPDFADIYLSQLNSLTALLPQDVPDVDVVAGRNISAEDAGEPVLVMRESSATEALGAEVGDRLTYAFASGGFDLGGLFGGGEDERATITFEIVGLTQATEGLQTGFISAERYTLVSAFPEEREPANISIVVSISDEQVPALKRELAGVTGLFVIETSVFTRLVDALLGAFTAFPTLVAALGLVVGGVVIANSVALTTMERRNEIAVMKAVGLQRERVLFMLLLENGLLGLIGGLIGVGIGFVALALLLSALGAGQAIPYGTGFALMGLCVLVAVLAALTTAWGAAGEKPLNVLRTE